MMTESDNINDLRVFYFFYRWHKVLILIGVLAAVLAYVFSSPYFITPKFRSSVIMYPTYNNSISKSLINENSFGKQDIMEFGDEEQAEQMLQILNSNKIRDNIIQKFNLAEHYDINFNEKFAQTNLNNEYESNISYKQTEYMAVKISVLDKDPQMAADIANEITLLYDSIKNSMQKERALKAFRIVEDEYLSWKEDVQQKEDSLTQLRMLGVHDYESQAEMMNKQLAIEISKGNKKGIAALEERLGILAKYGGAYVSIRDALEHEKKQLSYVKARYAEAKIDATQEIQQKFIIESAYASERKVFPNVFLIMVISVFLSVFMATIIILLFEKMKELGFEFAIFKRKPAKIKEEIPTWSVPAAPSMQMSQTPKDLK